MSDKITKSPQIRFAGFTDAWEQRKLGDMATFINGRAYKQDELLDKGKYRVLRVGNFYTNGEWYWSDMELGEKYYAEKGDLLYTWSATFGPHIWDGEKVIYHYHIWKVELSDQLDKSFAVQLLEYDKAKVTSDKNGSTMIHITKKGMEEKVVALPSVYEQRKIGEFLDKLNQLITLHQRKLELLKDTRKSLLQKMFPKEGANVPEIRFAGFTDAWEQRTVSELADRYDNLRVPITASERVAGSTPYYGANGIQDYVEGFTHEGEFILVAEDGASDLQNYPVQYVNGKVWVNNHAHVLQAKSEIADNKFLMNAMKHTNIEPYLVGGGRAKLNADVMMKISFRVPELAEQKQIGSFFANLDNLITLHQGELYTLKVLEKSLLHHMFI